MARPTRCIINLAAVRHNFQLAQTLAGSAQLVPAIKANGYGHGLLEVAHALDAPMFAVASIEEARQLRLSGLAQPILLLEGVFEPSEIEECADERFTLVVHTPQQLAWLAAYRGTRPISLWFKLETGMHRLGLSVDDASRLAKQVATKPQLKLNGVMTHLACADVPAAPLISQQLSSFEAGCASLPAGLSRSVCNSAALLSRLYPAEQWARPGIMLYGASPFAHRSARELGLRPAMSVQSSLIAVKAVRAGDSVGYGADWVAETDTRIGVVAIGYGDGYPRHARAGTPVWLRGQTAPLVGRVSMDMLTVDLQHLPEAEVGDAVELWGEQVPADDVARHCGTIAYELFTSISLRVPRHYLDELGDD